MTAPTLSDAIEQARRHPGRELRTHCTAVQHGGDAHPSLDVIYINGKVLVNCRSRGCATEAILEGAGLGWDALFDGPLPARAARPRPTSPLEVAWAEEIRRSEKHAAYWDLFPMADEIRQAHREVRALRRVVTEAGESTGGWVVLELARDLELSAFVVPLSTLRSQGSRSSSAGLTGNSGRASVSIARMLFSLSEARACRASAFRSGSATSRAASAYIPRTVSFARRTVFARLVDRPSATVPHGPLLPGGDVARALPVVGDEPFGIPDIGRVRRSRILSVIGAATITSMFGIMV